ncbi:MAG: type III pantothenate kinase [Gallionella sp.]
MMLLIDSGNTRIKWALVQGMEWLRSGVLPVEQVGKLTQHLAVHCDQISKGLHHIEQVWVSNVAGEEVALQISNFFADQKVKPHFVSPRAEQCGVHNGYSQPGELGSDRWAALLGAWHLIGGECLVVNCGTATTIDALSEHGEFMGGLILPGVDLMLNSLCDTTAQLKTSRHENLLSGNPGEYVPFPKNTADAIFSGVIQASCGAIQRQLALLDHDNSPVVLSGGAAEVLQEHLRHVTGEPSRLREEVQCGHSRTRGLRPTVSWPHLRHVTDKTTSHSTGETTSQSTKPPKNVGQVAGYRRANNARQVAGYSEASRLREEVQCGHSRTRGLRPTVSWPHLHMPLHIVDNLVLQGLLIIAQEASDS